jgi:hypothetical protein
MMRKLVKGLGSLLRVAVGVVVLELLALAVLSARHGSIVLRDSGWGELVLGRRPDRPPPLESRSFVFDPLLVRMQPPRTLIDTTSECDDGPRAILTDDQGYAVVPDPLPDPELGVAVLGGSTMFGVGATGNATTVPALIQAELRRAGIRANVHDIAIRGATSYLELVSLRRFLLDHDVDLVVAVSGRNDAHLGAFSHHPLVDDSIMERRTREIREMDSAPLKLYVNGDALRERARHWSFFVDGVLRLAQRPAVPGATPRPAESDEAWAGQDLARLVAVSVENYGLAAEMAAARGAAFLMFLQPTLYTKPRWSAAETACIEGLYRGLERRLAHHRDYEDRFYALFRAQPKPFPFVDLTDVFADGDATYYDDNAHYIDAGATILARRIAEEIVSRRGAPPALSSEPR